MSFSQSLEQTISWLSLPAIAAELDRGRPINEADWDGKTCLHWAAIGGQVESTRFLIERGADVNAVAQNGWTPIAYAASWGKAEVVEVLLRYGASLHFTNREGLCPLQAAVHNGHVDVVRLLLQAGSDPAPAMAYLQTEQPVLAMANPVIQDLLRSACAMRELQESDQCLADGSMP